MMRCAAYAETALQSPDDPAVLREALEIASKSPTGW